MKKRKYGERKDNKGGKRKHEKRVMGWSKGGRKNAIKEKDERRNKIKER